MSYLMGAFHFRRLGSSRLSLVCAREIVFVSLKLKLLRETLISVLFLYDEECLSLSIKRKICLSFYLT